MKTDKMRASNQITTIFTVDCGNHTATSCNECPGEHGAAWCNGDCVWSNDQCISKGKITRTLF